MWTLQEACRGLLLDYHTLLKVLCVFEHKRNICYSMLLIPALWYFDTSVIYPPMISWNQTCCNTPHASYTSNICEISLYNRQLVITTSELIYVVWAAHRWGKIVVKQDYILEITFCCTLLCLETIFLETIRHWVVHWHVSIWFLCRVGCAMPAGKTFAVKHFIFISR